MHLKNLVLIVTIVFSLYGCQTGTSTLDPDHTALKTNPSDIDMNRDLGDRFLWGGEIAKLDNLENTTEITIIGYPLNNSDKPKFNDQSTGRFIAVYPGFLEPTDYRQGMLVSVTGTLTQLRDGKIEQADYMFPVLNIEQVKLQGLAEKGYRLPISIGIGIGF